MNTANETTRVLVLRCACCGHPYADHGCKVGDCTFMPILMSEQFDPYRYLSEQGFHPEAVTPFAEVADAPRTAVESATAIITRDGRVTLFDLEIYMLDEGFEAKEVHDAVAHLVLTAVCHIDDASALTLVAPKRKLPAKPEPVIEVKRTFMERVCALFTGGR